MIRRRWGVQVRCLHSGRTAKLPWYRFFRKESAQDVADRLNSRQETYNYSWRHRHQRDTIFEVVRIDGDRARR